LGQRKDGSIFPFELGYSEMRLGERRYFVGVVRDETERKKNEAEIVALADQQGAVVELGQNALKGIDLSELFDQAAALVAQTLQVGRSVILELLAEDERFQLCSGVGWRADLATQTTIDADTRTPAGLAVKSAEPVTVENLSLDERFGEGAIVPITDVVSVASVVIDGREKAFGVLEAHSAKFRPFTAADVSFLQSVANVLSAAVERRRAEESHDRLTQQLYQSQKMEAIGQLAGGVAHDFNNILMIIDGYTRKAQDNPAMTEEIKSTLDHVLRAAGKAAGLTRQLLVFGRRQPLESEVVAATSVLPELEILLDPLLGETIDLRINVPDTEDFIETDVVQLSQALVNLAINARDAMPRGGPIEITMTRIDVDQALVDRIPTLSLGSYIRVDVSDEGEGMDEDTLSCIFDPFFTTKEQGKGTGLGLAMVYGFVDQSNGAIDVQSEVGHGTVFNIYLPTVDKFAEITLDPEVHDLGANGETILLAEDDDDLRNLVRLTLESLGYSVLVACDGFEALEIEADYDGQIDLLLSDVVMPNLGGIELASALRETRPDTSILLMSGYPSRGEIRQIDLPADIALLHKPCPPMNLARAIREVIGEAQTGS
jgi:signal transduction histidine kinase/ActR/RegA family two-component response regulator